MPSLYAPPRMIFAHPLTDCLESFDGEHCPRLIVLRRGAGRGVFLGGRTSMKSAYGTEDSSRYV